MPKVQLPPGCSSLRFADGMPPAKAARPGGYVNVSDDRARAIDSMSGNGDAGLVTGKFREFGGSSGKPGRVCCGRRWYAWSLTCPRCGGPTELERLTRPDDGAPASPGDT